MFKLYRDADLCIIYLEDADLGSSPDPLGKSDRPCRWFKRGWTLQELLAPERMIVYDKNWEPVGTKSSLASEIAHITRIDASYLTHPERLRGAYTAAKIIWIAGRETTYEEDIVYSMLGLLGIKMPPNYEKGQRHAFWRLQKKLLSTTSDESLFVWKMSEATAGNQYPDKQGSNPSCDEWGLLAPSPDWFKDCGNLTTQFRHSPRIFQMDGKISRDSILPIG